MIKKLEIRNEAQDLLIHGMQAALSAASEDETPKAVLIEMEKQFDRVEKLFGYVAGSCGRGV